MAKDYFPNFCKGFPCFEKWPIQCVRLIEGKIFLGDIVEASNYGAIQNNGV